MKTSMRIVKTTKSSITCAVFDIEGNITGDDSIELRRFIRDPLAELPEEEKPNVVINLDNVSIMDSSGLNALKLVWAEIQGKGGRLALATTGKGKRNLLVFTGLVENESDIYKNVEQALESF